MIAPPAAGLTPTRKAWMKQPGECCDSKGIPIYPGDLLKSLHFTGARRKRYWLYHLVVYREGALRMAHPHTLASDKPDYGCLLSPELAAASTIISGYGPGDCLDYEDRPRRQESS